MPGGKAERTSNNGACFQNLPDPDRPGRRRYFRNPNHLNPVKRELALNTKFPKLDRFEDKDYSARLLKLLNTEEYIEEPIYHYLFRKDK